MKKRIVLMLVLNFYSVFYAYNKQHVALLKKFLVNNSVVNISRCDFRGAGSLLKGISCSGGQLSGATFAMSTQKAVVGGIISVPNQKTDLTGSNFSNSVCVSVDFSNTILKNVNFSGADLLYANFSNADLTGAIFTNVQNAELAIFCGAIMPDGSSCSNGIWQNQSKSITLYCNCPKQKEK